MALKTFKPVTPGLRQLVIVDRSELHKGKPVKSLTEGKSSKGGRNNNGRITVRFRGGGHKQTYRIVDFKRRKLDMPAKVERLLVAAATETNRDATIVVAATLRGLALGERLDGLALVQLGAINDHQLAEARSDWLECFQCHCLVPRPSLRARSSRRSCGPQRGSRPLS